MLLVESEDTEAGLHVFL